MTHRAALITASSIAIVVAAAAVAVGANFGILSVADSRPVGRLSASAATVAVASPSTSPVAHPKTAVTQKYIIKKAGRVEVAASKGGLRLVDVAVRRGWTWALAQTADRKLTITFRSHAHTYKFVARLGRHRTIVARVDEPITKVVPSRSTALVAWSAPTAAGGSAAAAPAATSGGESDHGEGGGGGAGADD